MYKMDYKIGKELSKLSKIYEDEFIKFLSQFTGSKMTNNKQDLARKAVKCFFNNASFYVKVDAEYIVVTLDENDYSKPLIYNCRKVNRKVSYQYSRAFFSWLHQSKHIEFDIGYVGNWNKDDGRWVPKDTMQSRIYLGETLKQKLKDIVADKRNLTQQESVIELRDTNKNLVTRSSLPKHISELKDMLNTYNQISRNFNLVSQGIEFDVQLKKVFNNSSFEKGGRSYVVGKGAELLKRHARKALTVDGEPVCEIDFKSLHPRLVAEIMEVTLPENFDPYGITMDGYEKYCLRDICKLMVLCLFNASSMDAAISAVRFQHNNKYKQDVMEWKENGWVPEVIEYREILRRLIEHNSYAKPYMFTGYGIDLQNLDSRIMDFVLEYFIGKEEFALPIHDSVIVRQSLKEDAVRIMRVAYKHVMGSDNNCVLEVK